MSEVLLKISSVEINNSSETETESYAYLSGVLTQNQLFDANSGENCSTKAENSSSVEDYIPYDQRFETYIVPIIFLVIFFVGIVGNGTLVHIFIRQKSMRSLPNTFILCLAVGDLMVILGTVPFISLIYTLDSWPFGEFICKFSEFMRDLSIGVTVLTLSVLSFDRYIAIAMPFSKLKQNLSKRVVIIIIIVVWTVSVMFAIPGAYNSQVMRYNISDDLYINVCYPFPQEFGHWYPKMVVLTKFLLYYVIPLVSIGSFYLLMARRLLRSTKHVSGLNTNHSKHLELRTRVAKMVFTLAIIFAVCFLPNHIFMLWFYFTFPDSLDNYNTFWHIFKITGYCLTFSNSCLNPVTLYLISGKFRTYFKRYLFGCFVKRAKLVRKRTYRARPLLFYSTSMKSTSLVRHNTNSTRL